nr:response regulator transcription factor [Euzebyales bacterium]
GVDVAADPSAHSPAGAQRYDLVVVDLPLPSGDGLAMLERLLQRSDVPVVAISATAGEAERVRGLDLGADDFVGGPVSVGEFTARIRSVLRRRRLSLLAEAARTMTLDGLTVDPVSRRVEAFGAAVTLTALEFELLLFFMRHPGQVLSRGLLLQHVWGRGGGDGATVTVRVRRLREKIERDPANPQLINTVWGIGYRFGGPAAVPAPAC